MELSAAHNGEQTCSVRGFYVHSRYNPKKEAERFVDSIPAGEYKFIVITEPALSYCAFFLRKYHPQAILIAVRFCNDFFSQDSLWDYVIHTQTDSVSERLYDIIGEEDAGQTLFLSWKPSEQPFLQSYTSAWKEIKEFGKKCRDVLATRSYFTPRWTLNSLLFCSRAERCLTVCSGDQNIVLAAAGPSLMPFIPYLQRDRSSFFLLAVSSALESLVYAGVYPDLIITTDGGYWAKKHLNCLLQNGVALTIPIAAATEAAIPSSVFGKYALIPLEYGDAVDSYLLTAAGIHGMQVFRNGTVSGTAVQFALGLTTKNVYVCGLDLAPNATGYSHAMPNALEQGREISDNRLLPKESRFIPLQNGALDTYASWFVSREPTFYSRIRRLVHPDFSYARALAPIPEVSWENLLKNNKSKTPITFTEQKIGTRTERIKNCKAYLIANKNTVLALPETKEAVQSAEAELTGWLKAASIGAYIRAIKSGAQAVTELKTACTDLFDRLIGRLDA